MFVSSTDRCARHRRCPARAVRHHADRRPANRSLSERCHRRTPRRRPGVRRRHVYHDDTHTGTTALRCSAACDYSRQYGALTIIKSSIIFSGQPRNGHKGSCLSGRLVWRSIEGQARSVRGGRISSRNRSPRTHIGGSVAARWRRRAPGPQSIHQHRKEERQNLAGHAIVLHARPSMNPS